MLICDKEKCLVGQTTKSAARKQVSNKGLVYRCPGCGDYLRDLEAPEKPEPLPEKKTEDKPKTEPKPKTKSKKKTEDKPKAKNPFGFGDDL